MDIWKVSAFQNKQNPLYTYAENPKNRVKHPVFEDPTKDHPA